MAERDSHPQLGPLFQDSQTPIPQGSEKQKYKAACSHAACGSHPACLLPSAGVGGLPRPSPAQEMGGSQAAGCAFWGQRGERMWALGTGKWAAIYFDCNSSFHVRWRSSWWGLAGPCPGASSSWWLLYTLGPLPGSTHCPQTLPLSIRSESPFFRLCLPHPPRHLISCFIFKLCLFLEKPAPHSYFSADKVGTEDRFLCARSARQEAGGCLEPWGPEGP